MKHAKVNNSNDFRLRNLGKAKFPLQSPCLALSLSSRSLCDCDNILCKSLPNSVAEAAITMTHLTTANNLFTLHYATSKSAEGRGREKGMALWKICPMSSECDLLIY